MKIRVLGGGWYGCHLAVALLKAGHHVTLYEIAPNLFAGASGGNPARLHLGFHYPRSGATRQACQDNHRSFMRTYGHLTNTIPVNVYAVAKDRSNVDWSMYKHALRHEVDFIELEVPSDLGLQNIEGAMLTGERHIVIREARAYFERELKGHVYFDAAGEVFEGVDPAGWDATIDCTFCARDGQNVDRYEVCVTGILQAKMPCDRSVTIMDGPFPSIYAWEPNDSLFSLTSALYTPLGRFKTYGEADYFRNGLQTSQISGQVALMLDQMARYWPECLERFRVRDALIRIRAMPLSGADARLVDMVKVSPKTVRLRAGKIDAVVHAEQLVKDWLCLMQ